MLGTLAKNLQNYAFVEHGMLSLNTMVFYIPRPYSAHCTVQHMELTWEPAGPLVCLACAIAHIHFFRQFSVFTQQQSAHSVSSYWLPIRFLRPFSSNVYMPHNIYIIRNENTLQLWDRRFRRNSSLQAVCDPPIARITSCVSSLRI